VFGVFVRVASWSFVLASVGAGMLFGSMLGLDVDVLFVWAWTFINCRLFARFSPKNYALFS
jgi:hypothetical protein